MTEREIRKKLEALRIRGGIGSTHGVRVVDGRIQCLGPLSWILSTGASIFPWARAIAMAVKQHHELTKVSGLPADVKAQAPDLKCNPHPAKDKSELKIATEILKRMITQRLCERAVEIIWEHQHLFTIDI